MLPILSSNDHPFIICLRFTCCCKILSRLTTLLLHYGSFSMSLLSSSLLFYFVDSVWFIRMRTDFLFFKDMLTCKGTPSCFCLLPFHFFSSSYMLPIEDKAIIYFITRLSGFSLWGLKTTKSYQPIPRMLSEDIITFIHIYR